MDMEPSTSTANQPPAQSEYIISARTAANWAEKYPWLVFRDSFAAKKGCRVCNQSIAGRASELTKHQETLKHIMRMEESSNIPQDRESIAYKFNRMKELELHEKIFMAKMAAFLTENNLQFALLARLIAVMLSCNDLQHCLKVVNGNGNAVSEYINNVAAAACTKSLYNTITSDDQYYSMAIDETTDKSKYSILAFVIRIFRNGEVHDSFVGLREIAITNAVAIRNAVLDLIEKYGLNKNKLISLATDNCSVMIGRRGGVCLLLQSEIKHLFQAGCVCHKLHLSCKHAIQETMPDVDELIQVLSCHFRNSAAKQNRLKNIQTTLKIPKLKLIAFSTTRWLQRLRSINRIIQQWDALIVYFTRPSPFRENMNYTIIKDRITMPQYIAYFRFLSEILTLTNAANIELQSSKLKIHRLGDIIINLLRQLLSKILDMDYLNNIDVSRYDLNSPEFRRNKKLYYDEVAIGPLNNINDDGRLKFSVQNNCTEFVIRLCQEIQERIDCSNPIFKFLKYCEPNVVRSNEEINFRPMQLVFGDLENMTVLENEYRLLRESHFPYIHRDKEINDFWHQIKLCTDENNVLLFKNLSRFVLGILTIPHSTANVERIFQNNNLNKTSLRNALTPRTCNNLLLFKEYIRREAGTTADWNPSPDFLK